MLADPDARISSELPFDALVDAILAKRNLGTALTDAPIVLALGPGFTAGVDCHGVVETKRGHYLGRLILAGSAIPNTGVPGDIGGYSAQRIIRATADGIFEPEVEIGQRWRPERWWPGWMARRCTPPCRAWCGECSPRACGSPRA